MHGCGVWRAVRLTFGCCAWRAVLLTIGCCVWRAVLLTIGCCVWRAVLLFICCCVWTTVSSIHHRLVCVRSSSTHHWLLYVENSSSHNQLVCEVKLSSSGRTELRSIFIQDGVQLLNVLVTLTLSHRSFTYDTDHERVWITLGDWHCGLETFMLGSRSKPMQSNITSCSTGQRANHLHHRVDEQFYSPSDGVCGEQFYSKFVVVWG